MGSSNCRKVSVNKHTHTHTHSQTSPSADALATLVYVKAGKKVNSLKNLKEKLEKEKNPVERCARESDRLTCPHLYI